MIHFLLICLGGAIGTGTRYLISHWALQLWGPSFPYWTLLVNGVGSFLIAIVMQVALHTEWISSPTRSFLTVGVLGGFTTYSSFNNETLQFFQAGELFKGLFNILAMVLFCLIAGFLGLLLAKWWTTS